MFSIDEPMPNTWVHIVEDHQKTRYKPTSLYGNITDSELDASTKIIFLKKQIFFFKLPDLSVSLACAIGQVRHVAKSEPFIHTYDM